MNQAFGREPTTEQERLRELVEQIFEDGQVDSAERDALRECFSSGGLTVAEVKRTLQRFVDATWSETIADGLVTREERSKLEAIVRELRLPPACIPDEVRSLLAC